MLQRLHDWWLDQSDRHRYFRHMTRRPFLLIMEGAAVAIYLLSDYADFFPQFFKALAMTVFLPSIIWHLFIWASAKYRPQDWEQF